MPILRFFYKFFFYFFSYPIYLYLKFKRIFLVAGMITSTGHTFQENHYFNLKKKYSLLPKNYKFLFITNHNHITEFSNKFLNYYDYHVTNNYLDYFKDDLCKTYSDIVYYNHLSHFTLNKKKISWLKGFQKQNHYYELFNKGNNFLSDLNLPKVIKNNHKNEKYIVIHIKDEIVNATAKKTDPITYIPLLKFIRKKKYKIFFIGREKMPKIFNNYVDWNYANSSKANYLNDIKLVSNAEFSVIFGSGLVNIPMILGKYYLYLGSWHLIAPSASKNCIFIPTLLKHKKNGKILSLKENFDFFKNSKIQIFKSDNLTPVNPNGSEILHGFKELMSLKEKHSKPNYLQRKYNNFFKDQPINYSKARISSNFIKKYKDFLF